MKVKQFLVQFEFDERTRWLVDDKEVTELLWTLANSLAKIQTDGAAIPRVTVLPTENAELVDAGALAVLQTKAGLT